MATKTVMDMDMVNINQETLFSKVQFPYVVPVEDLKHIHSYIKILFCARKIPNVQLVGRLKNFIENWKILTNDTEILSLVEGYTIPFHEIPLQKNIPNSPKLSQEEIILVQMEIHEMLNQGAVVETPNHLEGEPTSNKLETPKSVHTLPALEDGRFALSLKHSEEGRLNVQTGFEGCILCSSIKSCIQKICAVSLVREVLQVSLPLFWTRPSTKNFYKITQNSSFSVASPEHTKYDLLGRHVVNRPYSRRNINGQRHSNLPSSTTRVCTELKEISIDTNTENRVLWGDSRFINHDPVSTREESLKISEAVSGTSSGNTSADFRLTNEIGLLSSTIQSVLPAQIISGTYNNNKYKH